MQTVKHFIYGKDIMSGESNPTPLEEQIDAYLREHQNQSVSSLSTIVASNYKEAFVVFNYRDGWQKPNNSSKKQEKT